MSNEITVEERLKVAHAMIDHGGSFVHALGEALFHADPINTFKIKTTFSEYWQQYKIMFEEEQVNKK